MEQKEQFGNEMDDEEMMVDATGTKTDGQKQ